ncbi:MULTISPECIES: hypothetical protein [Halomonadaceae]|uniref:Copper resistance protein B n=1 Tax=Onishia taeanensis TaxID=284577 RepID=A0A328XGX0_9GAMM|nr:MULTISPECIES: hypothetical protein [Halomonas]RAR57076.1 copper resistance protein B [Halomonas taeanensis]
MKSKTVVIGTGSTLAMLVAAGAQASDGYDAPANWPSPRAEHSQGSILFDRLKYATPDKVEDALYSSLHSTLCMAWYG